MSDDSISIIVFWNSIFTPCLAPISKCQLLLSKNKDWKDKVQIIAISTDEDKEKAEEVVAAKGWNTI